MVCIDDRPDTACDRRVPGAWEGDLIIGAGGKTVAATLVERHSRFVIILGLPEGKNADGPADVLIDHVTDMPTHLRGSLILSEDFNTPSADMPTHLRGSLTWDQGTEMARRAALTTATNLPVYFAHPHSPWERPTNENTNGLIREYLPKGIDITSHQPYLNAIADELNDRPRQSLGFLAPREVFHSILTTSNVAYTT